MKIKISFLLLICCIVALLFCTFSCKAQEAEQGYDVTVNGDIEKNSIMISTTQLKTVAYELSKEDGSIQKSGYNLSDVIDQTRPLSEDNLLMLTAMDGTSAIIEQSSAHECYVYIENGDVNIDAPQHPRAVKIKQLKEITVIAKGECDFGIKLLSQSTTEYITNGNAKLFFFEQQGGELLQGQNSAKKYVSKNLLLSAESITGQAQNLVYLTNFDIVSNNENCIDWKDGVLCYNNGQTTIPIFGLLGGINQFVSRAYYDMQQILSQDKKLLVIEVDGLALSQISAYCNDLDILAGEYEVIASVRPAISNVSLATILTGKTPYVTDIFERKVTRPATEDIFDYCSQNNKSAKYVEGNGNLIITSLLPELSVADQNGYTDSEVFDNTKQALQEDYDLIFTHFHGVDDVNHEYSPISKEARQMLITIDDYIEQLIEGFNGTIIILTDHGHVTVMEEGKQQGTHGVFDYGDMYIPYYVIEND